MGISDSSSDPERAPVTDDAVLARAVFDAAPDGMVVVSAAGRVLAWNAQYLALWRIPRPMLDRGDAAEIWHHKASFLKAGEQARGSLDAVALAGGAPVFDEFELRDGRVLERHVAALAAAGVDGSFVVHWRDITERHRAAASLGQAQARLAAIFDHAINAILLADDDARYIDANPAACLMLGYSHAELVGLGAADIVVPGSLNVDAAWAGFLHAGSSHGRVQLRRKDGSILVAGFNAVAQVLPKVHLSILADVTEEARSQQRQVELTALLDLAMMGAEVAYWDADLSTGRVSSMNRHWHSMLGYEAGEIADELNAWTRLVHADDLPRRTSALAAHLEGRVPAYAAEMRMRHKAGHWVWMQTRGQVVSRDAQGKALRMIGTRQDISERKRAEHMLEGLAHTDSLTGILNRRRFAELAADVVALAVRHAQPVAVLMVDLDRFKAINDHFGHAVGDDVLRAFVQTAAAVMRQGDLFARLGGEEFAALLPQTDLEGAVALAERLRQRVRDEPARAAGSGVPYSVSIGVAGIPAELEGLPSIEALLQWADGALYRAKADGRDRVAVAAFGA